MLCAYYDCSCDSGSLFRDLKISQDSSFATHLNQYPVIYLDASIFTTNFKSQSGQIVHEMNDALSQELIEIYPEACINVSDSLPAQLLTVVEHTHKQFIFIIDEWDAICREMGDEDVMRAMPRQSIESYWVATTTYEGLKNYIMMNFDGLRDTIGALLVGKEERVDVLRFSNDIHSVNSRDAVLALLIHLGYLSYNRKNRTCRIPNQEVRQEFERTIQDAGWEVIANAINNSEQLLKDTLAGNEESVAKAIETVHQDNTSILQYNDENALAYIISLAYQTAHQYYRFFRELPTGKGFADIVLVPYRNVDKPAIVLELKYNKSAEGAISQIKEKHYGEALQDWVGEIVMVGVNYDKRTKQHTCVIERFSDNVAINVATSQKSGDKSIAIGEKNKQRILEYLATHLEVKSQEVAEVLSLGISRTKVYLSELADAGLILRLGANKDRKYKLKQ